MSLAQLRFNLAADPAPGPVTTDVAGSVSSFLINTQREGIVVPANGASGQAFTLAGTKTEALTIRFHSDIAAADFWAALYEVISSDDSLLMFEGTLNPGVVSADNPQWAGTVSLLSLDSGGDVGALRQQTITLPASAPFVQTIL